MFTRKSIWTTKAHTPTTYKVIKITDITEHMIPVGYTYTPTTYKVIKITDITEHMIAVYAYGFYLIVHGKPRPFQRLRRPVIVEKGGAYAITSTVLSILTRFRCN